MILIGNTHPRLIQFFAGNASVTEAFSSANKVDIPEAVSAIMFIWDGTVIITAVLITVRELAVL